jgi:hypothetical protein
MLFLFAGGAIMLNTINKAITLCSIASIIFWGCSSNPIQTTGGSSDTEISAKTIIGSVVDINGKPISNAVVWLNPIDSEKNLAPIDQGAGAVPPEVKPVMTDAQGAFRIVDVKIGDYAIEVNSGDSLAVLLYCSFDSADTVKKLPVDTLKPMVTISGTIIPNGSPDTRIVIDGINKPIAIDSLGGFRIKVPAGKHNVRFSPRDPTLKNYIVLPDLAPGAILDMGFIDPSLVTMPPPCQDSSCDISAMRLALNDMGLASVAVESVATFTNGRIIAINLRHRNLHVLSAEIARLTALKALDAGANQLHVPFPAISLCTSLTVLRLDSNEIPFVPNTIGAMLNLKELDLSENEISSLPISIVELKPDVLKLDNNRLLDMSGAIAQWADTLEPQWRLTQRSGMGGPPPFRGPQSNYH